MTFVGLTVSTSCDWAAVGLSSGCIGLRYSVLWALLSKTSTLIDFIFKILTTAGSFLFTEPFGWCELTLYSDWCVLQQVQIAAAGYKVILHFQRRRHDRKCSRPCKCEMMEKQWNNHPNDHTFTRWAPAEHYVAAGRIPSTQFPGDYVLPAARVRYPPSSNRTIWSLPL